MASFLKEKWEDLSTEELAREKGSYIAFTTGLEEGASREQFKSLMDPMHSLQEVIVDLKKLSLS